MNILNCTTITKPKLYKAKKFGVALSGLNNQINRLEQLKSDTDGYVKEQLDTIIDDLTDVFVDLKIETGVDV
jgi:3-methyladenine DNA glycosylase AlkC